MSSDKGLRELLDLAETCCAGTIADDGLALVDELLHEHPEWQEAYFQYLLLHVCLRRTLPRPVAARTPMALSVEPPRVLAFSGFAQWTPNWLRQSTLARVASIGLAATFFYGTFALLAWNLRPEAQSRGRTDGDLAVAVLGASDDARWSPKAAIKADPFAVRPGERFKLDSGLVELELNRGAKLVVEAPAEFAIDGDNKATLHAGKLVATVPPNAVGFTLETPTAKIIDLGTEFAAEVGTEQSTQIHVFKGTVVAQQLRPSAKSNQAVRLSEGEALQIAGGSTPFISIPIRPDRYLKAAKPKSKSVIVAVQASSGKEYRIVPGGLRDDAKAYVDRNYEWNGVDKNGLPASLVGADYVQTMNDDKIDQHFELYVTLSAPATLYVFFDKHAPKTPDWLSRFFTDTGTVVGLDAIPAVGQGAGESVDRTFTVWKRHFKAGTVWLGPNAWNGGHYGVAAVADPISAAEAKTESK